MIWFAELSFSTNLTTFRELSAMSESIYPSKICTKCKESKSLDEFYKCDRSSFGRTCHCKVCHKAKYPYIKKLTDEDRLIKKAAAKAKVLARKKLTDEDRLIKKENARIADNLRSRLSHCVVRDSKSPSAVRDLGCSIDFLKGYLASKFQTGMSWDNYGEWHIDHIKPLSKFNLKDRQRLLEAIHYTNLQPLWAIDNIKKSNKYKNSP